MKRLFQYFSIENDIVVGYIYGADSEDTTSAKKKLEGWVAESPETRKVLTLDFAESKPINEPAKYLKVSGESVEVMTEEEKKAVDDAEDFAEKQKQEEKQQKKNSARAKLKAAIPALNDDDLDLIMGETTDRKPKK